MPDHKFGIRKGQKPSLITSRGCAYRCSFCSPKLMWKKIQFHSPRRVVDEIKQIKKDFPRLRRLSIWDDLFAARRTRVVDIAKLLKDEGVKVKLNSGMRSELVSDDNCRLWKGMGLTRLGIGGESGSDRILKQLKGPAASVGFNQRALDIMHRHGMTSSTGIILGSPGETERDVKATYEWLLANYRQGKIMDHAINILNPLPGTPVWAQAERAGHVCEYESFDWSRLQHQSMDFRNEGEFKGRDGWMRLRRKDRSIYLNEDTVPQEDLFQMIEHYEDKIQWCSPAQIGWRIRKAIEGYIR